MKPFTLLPGGLSPSIVADASQHPSTIRPDINTLPTAGLCKCDPVPEPGPWGECSICHCAPQSVLNAMAELERRLADRRAHEVSAARALASLHPSQYRALHEALIDLAPGVVEIAVSRVKGLAG